MESWVLQVGWAPQGAAVPPRTAPALGGPSPRSPELPSIPRRGSLGLCQWLSVSALPWERASRGAVLHPKAQSPLPCCAPGCGEGLSHEDRLGEAGERLY